MIVFSCIFYYVKKKLLNKALQVLSAKPRARKIKACLLGTWYELEDRINDRLLFSIMSMEDIFSDHSTISRFRTNAYEKLCLVINKQLEQYVFFSLERSVA